MKYTTCQDWIGRDNRPTTSSEIQLAKNKNKQTNKQISQKQKFFTRQLHKRILPNIKKSWFLFLPNYSKELIGWNASRFVLWGHNYPETKTKLIDYQNFTGQWWWIYKQKFKKILVNWIQQYIIRILNHQVGFIPNLEEWFLNLYINVIHHINKRKDKKYMIISIYIDKAFDKIKHQFMIKKKSSSK